MYTIYIHKFPNGKVYVGCTAQRLDWRFGRNGEGYKSATKIWNAIQEFGWEVVKHEVLATTESRFEASRLEQYYIDYYQSANDECGYNTRKGGLGKPLPPMRQEAKDRISEDHRGRVGIHKNGLNYTCRPELLETMLADGYELGWYSPPPELCKKISEAKRGAVGIHKDGRNRYVKEQDLTEFLELGWERGGEPLPEAMKQHLSEINTGKTYSEETKQKLSEIRKGTILVHKGETNRRIKPIELDNYMSAGWEKGASPDWVETNRRAQSGRTQSSETRQKRANALLGKNVGRKHIHLGSEHKMVKSDEVDRYLAQGWQLGKPKS